MKEKIILTDGDGCILDWEWAFHVWMAEHGYQRQEDAAVRYDIGKQYGIPKEEARRQIRIFNESAAIGFLPGLRDAQYYVKRLHEEYSYHFHLITSLSKDPNAQKLRIMNVEKLFGKTAFSHYIFLDTGEDKDGVLQDYRDSGLWWIEDKITNAEVGLELGLRPLLMEHGHNMDYENPKIPRVKSWREIYDIIVD
jgi:hypothetical protein